MYRQDNHPDRREGEVWITNATEVQFREMAWKTKRLGYEAYNRCGHLIPFSEEGLLPVFVQSSELKKAGFFELFKT